MIDTLPSTTTRFDQISVGSTLTVVVVAAYPSLRAGLGALLADEPDLWVVERSPAALLGDDPPTPPSTALLVVDRGGLDPDVAASLAHTATADSLPVLWIGEGDVPDALEDAGGHLAPASDRATLVAAVRAVAAGLRVHDPRLPTPTPPQASQTATVDPLSPREHEVLTLVAAGHPNKAIARALGISEHTVKFHVSALLGKLGATSRTEAVTLATRRGLLSL